MRKLILFASISVSVLSTFSQTTYMRIWKDGQMQYQEDVNNIDSILFSRPEEQPLEAIDLGLPSGTKWASMNLGAQSPSGYGYFFQWGCVNQTQAPSWDNYCFGQGNALTKYCTESDYGEIDGLIYLESGDDPATQLLGSEWRTPTRDEIIELFNECWLKPGKRYGIQGCYFYGNNKKYLFVPYSGYLDLGGALKEQDTTTILWTSSLGTLYNDNACGLKISGCSDYELSLIYASRAIACTIRPVYNEPQTISLSSDSIALEEAKTHRLIAELHPKIRAYRNEDFVWESSDTTIATVSPEGIVTAHKKGESTITARYDTLSACCRVRVSGWLDRLAFTGAYVGLYDTIGYGTVLDTIQARDGATYYVKPVKAFVALFSSGFYIDENGEMCLSPDLEYGGMITALSTIYWAPQWANFGFSSLFVLGEWNILDVETFALQTIPTGKTNSHFIPSMQGYLSNLAIGDTASALSSLNMADSLGCEGAVMRRYSYHTTQKGYERDGFYADEMPQLFFTEGFLNLVNPRLVNLRPPMCGIGSHHLVAKPLLEQRVDAENYYHYGCFWHYDTATGIYSWNDEQVHWGEPYTYDYSTPAAAPSRTRGGYVEIHNVGDINTTRKIIEALRRIPTDNRAVQK